MPLIPHTTVTNTNQCYGLLKWSMYLLSHFPGGLVIRALGFHCRVVGLTPDRELRSHRTCGTENKKLSTKITTLRMGSNYLQSSICQSWGRGRDKGHDARWGRKEKGVCGYRSCRWTMVRTLDVILTVSHWSILSRWLACSDLHFKIRLVSCCLIHYERSMKQGIFQRE